ncbi:MAG: UDP-N-acetylmuramoyl-L-alanine--D-glutamate ligase [Candidatus Portnoybacteria bacterium]|nr:UDP-N-acetylmuramoyl-L-alanine--D-glutamate ligase [Candidatus Portnoybacteria bacterium]
MGLGLHDGGAGAAKFFVKAGAKVTVTDLRTEKQLDESLKKLKDLPVKYVLGKHRDEDFINTDLIIRNPAVPDDSPYLKTARKHNVPIDTDIGIFFAALRAVTRRVKLCPVPIDAISPPQIIGVTGTRGKSTTATLIYELLKTKYENVVLAGNIRKSVLLELPEIIHHYKEECFDCAQHKLRDDEAIPLTCRETATPRHNVWARNNKFFVVLELSSWQLEGLKKHKKSPHIAVITTILPDHLNRYKGMRDYIRTKKLIYKYQTPNDYLFLNKNDKIVSGFAREAASKVVFFTSGEARKYQTHLLGDHNLINAAAAVKVAKHFGIPGASIQAVFRNFRGLEGRIELVSEINGVKYINDTCATTPDATIAAIATVTASCQPPIANNLILIAGGTDKNLNFEKLAKKITENVDLLILLPGTATRRLEKNMKKMLFHLPPKDEDIQRKRIKSRIKNKKLKVRRVNSIKEAVRSAAMYAKKGDTVLLSPAGASFGLFRHEFERGKAFKEEVEYLKISNS